MRLAPAVPLLMLLLGGCHREPDFDQRYAEAEKAIQEKATAIDAELAARASASAAPSPGAAPAE